MLLHIVSASLQAALVNNITMGERVIRDLQGEPPSPLAGTGFLGEPPLLSLQVFRMGSVRTNLAGDVLPSAWCTLSSCSATKPHSWCFLSFILRCGFIELPGMAPGSWWTGFHVLFMSSYSSLKHFTFSSVNECITRLRSRISAHL